MEFAGRTLLELPVSAPLSGCRDLFAFAAVGGGGTFPPPVEMLLSATMVDIEALKLRF
jgi:hypothetical protein